VKAIGKITLPVTFGNQHNSKTEHITFDVVEMLYNYNAIFGRGVTNVFSAVLHPGYLCMKLPSAKSTAIPSILRCHQPTKHRKGIANI
jgi:hypothetical protein